MIVFQHVMKIALSAQKLLGQAQTYKYSNDDIEESVPSFRSVL